jgi:hypothetical protein
MKVSLRCSWRNLPFSNWTWSFLTFGWGRSSPLVPLATSLAKAVYPSSPPPRLRESIRKDPHVLWKAPHSFYRLLIHRYDARWITGFASAGVRPQVRAEFEDSELLKEYGQDRGGLFATSTLLEKHTLLHYRVKVIARVESVRMRYYAISSERRIRNAAVTPIISQTRRDVFE